MLLLVLWRRWIFHVNQGAPTKGALRLSHSMFVGLAVVWAVGRGLGPGLGVSISQEQYLPACCFSGSGRSHMCIVEAVHARFGLQLGLLIV